MVNFSRKGALYMRISIKLLGPLDRPNNAYLVDLAEQLAEYFFHSGFMSDKEFVHLNYEKAERIDLLANINCVDKVSRSESEKEMIKDFIVKVVNQYLFAFFGEIKEVSIEYRYRYIPS
jgi:hypothetical protein